MQLPAGLAGSGYGCPSGCGRGGLACSRLRRLNGLNVQLPAQHGGGQLGPQGGQIQVPQVGFQGVQIRCLPGLDGGIGLQAGPDGAWCARCFIVQLGLNVEAGLCAQGRVGVAQCALHMRCQAALPGLGRLATQGGQVAAHLAPDVGLQRQRGHGLQRGIHLVAALGHFQAQLVQPVAGLFIVAVVPVGALYVPDDHGLCARQGQAGNVQLHLKRHGQQHIFGRGRCVGGGWALVADVYLARFQHHRQRLGFEQGQPVPAQGHVRCGDAQALAIGPANRAQLAPVAHRGIGVVFHFQGFQRGHPGLCNGQHLAQRIGRARPHPQRQQAGQRGGQRGPRHPHRQPGDDKRHPVDQPPPQRHRHTAELLNPVAKGRVARHQNAKPTDRWRRNFLVASP